MIICICNRLSDRELVRHAQDGKSFEDIQIDTGLATRCGCCEDSARDIVARCCGARDVCEPHGVPASHSRHGVHRPHSAHALAGAPA